MIVDIRDQIITTCLLCPANNPGLFSSYMDLEAILIPQILLYHTLYLGYILIQYQFPLSPEYGTIFNSQGLTLDKVAIDLSSLVFSHGQFVHSFVLN